MDSWDGWILWMGLALAPCFVACGQSTGGTAACTGVTASYASIQSKIVSSQCLTCHANMSTYSGLLSNGITPGSPSSSNFYAMLSGGSMPKGGQQLCDTDITAISTWIQGGALNN